jgi:hypothetical protein
MMKVFKPRTLYLSQTRAFARKTTLKATTSSTKPIKENYSEVNLKQELNETPFTGLPF